VEQKFRKNFGPLLSFCKKHPKLFLVDEDEEGNQAKVSLRSRVEITKKNEIIHRKVMEQKKREEEEKKQREAEARAQKIKKSKKQKKNDTSNSAEAAGSGMLSAVAAAAFCVGGGLAITYAALSLQGGDAPKIFGDALVLASDAAHDAVTYVSQLF